MNQYISREEFEKTVRDLNSSLENVIIQSSFSSIAISILLLESKNYEETLFALEKACEASVTSILYSTTTDEQMNRYREYCSMQIEHLRKLCRNIHQS